MSAQSRLQMNERKKEMKNAFQLMNSNDSTFTPNIRKCKHQRASQKELT